MTIIVMRPDSRCCVPSLRSVHALSAANHRWGQASRSQPM